MSSSDGHAHAHHPNLASHFDTIEKQDYAARLGMWLFLGTEVLLFAGLFDSLNAQRTQVLNGLERVTRKQREAADKIRSDTLALQALHGETPPDQAKIDDLGNQLVWQTRIFEDRRNVIKFVCEVPTAIDQRLFALGRTIQKEIE